ncbi:MAG TPA: GGDEF domain-containing protein, partial [Rubrivivax sp.]|nr:GGDEF domain-containing protein [Rubrivivax sp.]
MPTTPAALAKGALRRLAQTQQEPTPENYARAYAEESGQPAPAAAATGEPAMAEAKLQGAAWATLVERLARNLERGGKQWTGARRKESLKRVLEGSRSDATRLLQRLQSLMTAWESDQPSDASQTGVEDPPVEAPSAQGEATATAWPAVTTALEATVRAGLAQAEPRAADLAARLSTLADGLASEGATAERAAQIDAVCQQARRLF